MTLALHADLVLEGPGGQRVVAADDFFDGPFTTVVRPDEILVDVRVPRRWQGQAFVEFARTNGSFALVGVGTCVDVRDGAGRGRLDRDERRRRHADPGRRRPRLPSSAARSPPRP